MSGNFQIPQERNFVQHLPGIAGSSIECPSTTCASCCHATPPPPSAHRQTMVQRSVALLCVWARLNVFVRVCMRGCWRPHYADPAAVCVCVWFALFFVAFCLPFNLLAGLKMHLPRLLLLIRHVLRTHLLFMKTLRRSAWSFRLTLRFVGVNSMRVVIKNYVKRRANAVTCIVNPTGLQLMATINN